MSFVSPLDAAWLFVESEDTPMHVGGVQIYSPPADAAPDFVQQLVSRLREQRRFSPPFSLRVKRSRLRRVLPEWEETDDIDLNHHFKHWGLPSPGGQRELDELIAHLHASELDMRRPLWEMHLIEGLSGNRYALYTKIHHSLMDGVGGMRMMQAMLSADAEARDTPAPWASPKIRSSERKPHFSLNDLLRQAGQQARTLPGLYGSMSALAKSAMWPARSALKAPYMAPKTRLNSRVSRERGFASFQIELARVQAIASNFKVTVNDVFLGIFAGALRRYLQEQDALPQKSLIAGLPVSVRPKDDMQYGTSISFILASLETSFDDPLQRIKAIHRSTAAAKQNLQQMPAAAFTEYTLLLMSPYIAQLVTGVGGMGPPMFNLIISNVPGPKQTLYFNGARLEAIYPLSIVTQGQGLNITFMSYCGQLNIGYTACHRSLPDLHRLVDYTKEELEQTELLLAREGKARRAPRKRKA